MPQADKNTLHCSQRFLRILHLLVDLSDKESMVMVMMVMVMVMMVVMVMVVMMVVIVLMMVTDMEKHR